MKIKKVLNNNAVTVINENNEEIVVMGLGLAFKKKSGDELEEEKIERVFTLQNREASERLKNLICEIPIDYMKISEEIITYAEEKLEKKLNENIYLTLTDHINFAITRHKQGLSIKNPMLWEIRRFYKQEFNIGLKAVDIIKAKLGIALEEDDAASIALHLVNAQLNVHMPDVMDITNIIQGILSIIKYHFGISLDEDSLDYYRLVTHLKFFAQRMLNNKTPKGEDDYLYSIVRDKYPDANDCAERIKTYIKKTYDFTISNEEMTYLIVHIQRVVHRNSKE